MTTAELLDLLARFPGVLTLDDVAQRIGRPRRVVEEAVQQARLEGQPVITDGGLRLARTSAEAFAVYRALRRRMTTQTKTAWAVRSAAMLMERGEAAARKRVAEAQLLASAASSTQVAPRARTSTPAPGQTELFGG